MMLDHTFGMKKEAALIRTAVEKSIDENVITEDLAEGGKAYSTSEVGDWLADFVKNYKDL